MEGNNMINKNRGKLDNTLAAMFSNIEYSTDYLFYAHMIGQCSIKIRENLPAPAGVMYNIDHYDLIINPTMFDEYSLVERLAILKHEMLHILFDHVGRIEDRVHTPWNFATDCALNQQCNEDHLPDDCVLPKSLGEMLGVDVPVNESAEFYYDLIKEVQKQEKENGNGNGSDNGSDGGSGSGMGNNADGHQQEGKEKPKLIDDHSTWSESKGDKELQQDITKKMIEKAQIDTIKINGTVPESCSDWLALHTRKSEVNWRKVLRGIVGNKRVGKRSTIMRSDRRFPKRGDLRGKTKDRMFNLLVIADVSGSMNDEAITQTLGEVQHICDVTKTDVDLIQIDTNAYQPEKLNKKTKIFSRKGNGGTELHPALDMAKKHNIDYQAVVVLTDGGLCKSDIEHFQALGKRVIWLIEETGFIMEEMNSGKMQAFQLKCTG